MIDQLVVTMPLSAQVLVDKLTSTKGELSVGKLGFLVKKNIKVECKIKYMRALKRYELLQVNTILCIHIAMEIIDIVSAIRLQMNCFTLQNITTPFFF